MAKLHQENGVQPLSVSIPEHGDGVSLSLVRFLSSQDEDAFASLARAILPRLLRYFRALGSSGDKAEDLAQDVLCVLYRKAHTLRDPESFWPWLYKVARNALLQQVRRDARQVIAVNMDAIEEARLPAQDRRATENSRDCSFAEWMEWLKPGERQVMALRYVEEFEYDEIALALAIPIGTVKSRLFQAKKKLSKRLGSAPEKSKDMQ